MLIEQIKANRISQYLFSLISTMCFREKTHGADLIYFFTNLSSIVFSGISLVQKNQS